MNENGIMYAKMHFAYIVPWSNRSVYFTHSLLFHLSLKIKIVLIDRNQKAETSQSHFSPEISTLYISQLNMMSLILSKDMF